MIIKCTLSILVNPNLESYNFPSILVIEHGPIGTELYFNKIKVSDIVSQATENLI